MKGKMIMFQTVCLEDKKILTEMLKELREEFPNEKGISSSHYKINKFLDYIETKYSDYLFKIIDEDN